MLSHEKSELSPQTMKILIYIDKHSPAQEKLSKHFSKSPLFSERMKELQQCNPQLVLPHLSKGGKSAYYFTSSGAGKRLVEDFRDKKRLARNEFLRHSVLVPVVVTLLTMATANFLRSILPAWLARLLQQ